MKTGKCFKGCTGREAQRFPQIGETTVYASPGVEVRTRLHQCPDCGLVLMTYKDAVNGPWGQREPRYWRTIREGTPIGHDTAMTDVRSL